MKGKPELLYIAHRIPYPPNKGDKIRTFNQIRFLSGHFSIDLVALVDDPNDFQYQGDLEPYCRSVSLFGLNRSKALFKGGVSLLFGASISQGYFSHAGARQKVSALLASKRYRAVVCFSSPTAGCLSKIQRDGIAGDKLRVKNRPRLIMDFCDVDSEKWRQYARTCRGALRLVYMLEARRLGQYEVRLSRSFDASVFVSRAEADLFREMTPYTDRVYPVSNGVDCRFFSPGSDMGSPLKSGDNSPGKKDRSPLVLMFPGAMDYYANVQAVFWFGRKVLPLLSDRLEREGLTVRFDIVGKNPAPKVRALAADPRVRVTGFVKDIRPYYRGAHAVVIPLQIARGIQNKVLEAMAMGRPVVASPQAVEGLGAEAEMQFKSAVTAGQYVEAVLGIVRNPEEGQRLGERARAYVWERFSWEACLEPMLGIINGTD